MAKRRKKSSRRSGAKRISEALKRYLKRQNRAFRTAEGVRVKKHKTGALTFFPVKRLK